MPCDAARSSSPSTTDSEPQQQEPTAAGVASEKEEAKVDSEPWASSPSAHSPEASSAPLQEDDQAIKAHVPVEEDVADGHIRLVGGKDEVPSVLDHRYYLNAL